MSMRIAGIRAKPKSSGWAAFDLRQRQTRDTVETATQLDIEPYPPLQTALPPYNNTVVVGNSTSFSSVILPSIEFPSLSPESGSSKPQRSEDCSSSYNVEVVEDNSRNLVLEKLVSLYSWADNSLLEDVMLTVNDDFKIACKLLDVMGSSETGHSGTNSADLRFESHNYSIEFDPGKSDKDVLFGMGSGFVEPTPSLDYCSNEKHIKSSGKSNFSRDFTCDTADIQYMLERLKSVPLEPELEEDDIYLNHRKNAIKKMRSATRNSRLATSCFLRGDHFSAQQHSFRARQEWSSAEKLNARAAKEILSTRNVENDIWKLDLHGLHAAEAVQVLQEHLWKIETHVPLKHSISSSRVKTKNGITDSASSESFGSVDLQLDRNLLSTKHSPMLLEVITGRGNHSRGQASLPSAIKTFLHDNR